MYMMRGFWWGENLCLIDEVGGIELWYIIVSVIVWG